MSDLLGLEIIENRWREAFFSRGYSDPMTVTEAIEAWGADPANLESGSSFVGVGIAGRGRQLPVLILTKELDLGTPALKWFRRMTMTGKGVCMIRASIDGRVLVDSRVTLEHFAGGTKWLAFPRGTVGRRIRLEIWGEISSIQSPLIEWEPYGGPIQAQDESEA